jgi:tetratricopeptide (TPR) repeat protein
MSDSSRMRWCWRGLLLVIVVGGGVWLLRHVPAPGPPLMPPGGQGQKVENRFDRATSLKLIELRNLGLGFLENHQFDESITVFRQILELVPDEPFALCNLAISQVKQATEVINDRQEPGKFAQAFQESQATIQRLEAAQPTSALPYFLRAVLTTRSSDPAETVLQLKLATDRDPSQAAWWFQWFELGRSLRDPSAKEAALAAGQKAADLAPDNLFVQKEFLAELLFRQSEVAERSPDQAASQTKSIISRLERFREPVRVLGASVQVQAKIDVVPLLDAVVAAAKEDQWSKARNEFFKVKNILSQETASDADLIHPSPLTYVDPLNFVALDFSPDVYRRADLPDEALPQIPIEWKLAEGGLPDTDPNTFALRWTDVDLDGIDDLITAAPGQFTAHLRSAERSGWKAVSLNLDGRFLSGFLTADLDDDVVDLTAAKREELGPVTPDRCHEADPDFVLFGSDGVLLVNNILDPESKVRRLEAIPSEKAGFQELRDVMQALLVDFDHDGDLDLITVSLTDNGTGMLRLWINRGNFSFAEATDRSLLPPNGFDVTSLVAVDWDQDNDVDILVSGKGHSGWMENLRHGRLRFRETGAFWPSANQLMIAEINGRGNWDLVLADEKGLKILFTEKPMSGLPVVARETRLLNATAFLPEAFDFDNDGGMDVLTTNHHSVSLQRNNGLGDFERQDAVFPSAGEMIASWADVDNDGDVDCVMSSGGKLHLLINEGGDRNHWLNVRFRGQQIKANEQGASKRVNHYGIGNIVELKAGARYQAQIAAGQTTRFGLGPLAKADVVRVIMTNGVPQNRIEPHANELICERQVLLTSCPYLFTWNGSRFEFCTDLLWASPLGLKASQTELVPWRDWEHLKIDGRLLQVREGEYQLRITEELWEAAYFDQVRLTAVDHPADTQVFTNEKVGSPVLATPRIHTVQKPLRPRVARDQSGRDWLSQLSQRDDIYARSFERKLAQGLCEEHYLELDLGELREPARILLFLTGWVRPTDTNINVALDQNPDLPLPSGLALWTPDASDNWREVSPHVGFPNGKTKTIVLDLSEAFTPGRYQLRLVSNREFYWDEAFFTVDEESVGIREHELPLLGAELHFRGFSRGILPEGDGPETYDYDQLAAIPPWPEMSGSFTRYGDVLPLLTRRDDLLAVLGPGDEMSLAFGAPSEPLPDGWVRDFVLHNIGWVKDCLLNTWEGQRVDPLPFGGMNGHDYWSKRPVENDGGYRDYLRIYQSRRQFPLFRSFVKRWRPDQKNTIPAWERNRRTGD